MLLGGFCQKFCTKTWQFLLCSSRALGMKLPLGSPLLIFRTTAAQLRLAAAVLPRICVPTHFPFHRYNDTEKDTELHEQTHLFPTGKKNKTQKLPWHKSVMPSSITVILGSKLIDNNNRIFILEGRMIAGLVFPCFNLISGKKNWSLVVSDIQK